MTPLFRARAVVITLETQKCRKKDKKRQRKMPGVAPAFALRSTLSLRSSGSAQLCRFAPVHGSGQLCRFINSYAPLNLVALLLDLALLSFLPSRSIAQPTDNPIDHEKLCSALNFCWLENKRPCSNGKT